MSGVAVTLQRPGDDPAMRLACTPQRRRGLRRIGERFSQRALIREREVNDLKLSS